MRKIMSVVLLAIFIFAGLIYVVHKYSGKEIPFPVTTTWKTLIGNTDSTIQNIPHKNAPITHADLFKNGWALITRTISVNEESRFAEFEIDADILHGSVRVFPQDSQILKTTRKVPAEQSADSPKNWIELFAGKEVTLELNDKKTLSGIVQIPEQAVGGTSPFLTLKCEDGTYYTVNPSNIVAVRSKTAGNSTGKPISAGKLTEKSFVKVIPPANYKGPVTISYLTKGIFWAPSYQFDLSADKLAVAGNLELCNQLEDLNDVEFRCISGYPNLEMSGVASPLAANQRPDLFLLNASSHKNNTSSNSSILSQASILSNSVAGVRAGTADFSISAGDTGDSDMEFLPIGKFSIKKGEILHIQTGSGSADYELVVLIKEAEAFRDIDFYRRTDSHTLESYDAIRFRNPMKTAITTAPAMFFRGNNILGQSVNHWVAPEAESVFRITKNLNCFATVTQNTIRNEERVRIGENNYTPRIISKNVIVRNGRPALITAIITMTFSGEIVEVDESVAKPVITPLYSVTSEINPQQEFRWEVKLQPGQQIELKQTLRVFL